MRKWLLLAFLIVAVVAIPPQWYPRVWRAQWADWFGAGNYRPPPMSMAVDELEPEMACPEDLSGWREAQTIDGVEILAAPTCIADDPYAVAAFVRGTNNVSAQTLAASGLTADAVEKGRDLDGDGDPDEIHIRLEIVELNGGSPELPEPATQYAIAPGIKPGFWAFAPKYVGMATENFESLQARAALRLPSPAIRVEQGDTITITLENGHYMPHTIHLHGVDHQFVDVDGEGNDGVPMTSEIPVMPGAARSYQVQPRQAGTAFYHCHVQPHVHVMMGLQGLFVVEENRPNNWVQTLNVGAGQVRAPSRAVREEYDREYDLHYVDVDPDLNNRIQQSNDPRVITESMHRDYDITDARTDYFLLNGHSFPYTFRDSLVVVAPDERIKLRVVNGGMDSIALHTHGHKVTVTHRDGVFVDPIAQEMRDVVTIDTAQRLDLLLDTSDDGLHSYGAGIWLFHDHGYRAVTTDGIGPGGHISAIVYESFLGANGWPRTQGVGWTPYFTEAYYRKELPVWQAYAPDLFGDPGADWGYLLRLIVLASCIAASAALLVSLLKRSRR
jgi:hypothetical protein